MTHLTNLLGMPFFLKSNVVNGGGSIIIPNPLIHKIYPDTEPFGSNPCEQPKIVTPNYGGVNVYSK